MSQHAIFSPSASDRWLNCSASHFLHEQQGSSKYAHEGTVCHSIAEQCLNNPGLIPSNFLGQVVEGVSLNDELIDAIQVYYDICMEYIIDENYNTHVEMKVNVFDDCWGTADFVAISNKEIWVIDLKMGKGISVDAENNNQLSIYGLGVLNALPPLEPHPRLVHLVIVQPRDMQGDVHSVWTRPTRELIAWEDEVIIPAIDRIERGERVYSPGEKQCQWCSHKARCKALGNFNLQQAQLEFKHLADPEARPGTDFSNDELAELLKSFKMIKAWMKAIEIEALDTVRMGGKIPGYKVVKSRKFREWSSEEAAKEILSQFIPDDMYITKLVSPAQAEKKLKKNKSKIKNVIVKPQGDPVLAPMSDKRPPIPFTAEEEFKNHA